MKAAIMQPYFFPYIGYFQLIHAADKFVFLDDVNFINRGWINRNRILLNEQAHTFTVPLKEASQNKLINETTFVKEKWPEKILKTIEHAYKKAPHYEAVHTLLKAVLFTPATDIATLSKNSIRMVCDYLHIDTLIINSSAIFYNKQLHGQDRIIDINKQLSASDYINAIGGQELYSKALFLNNDINLHFLETQEIVYQQFSKKFVPNLSIIDVLMFNSIYKVKLLLNAFSLN